MSLSVEISKKVNCFTLEATFTAGNENLGLLGASGCGKSMTLKCIAGIETPDEGRIVLDDRVLFDSDQKINIPPQQRKVGYLFQNYALFPNMTVAENIGAGVKGNTDAKRILIKENIRRFFLEGLENKRPHQLSGGQQQRVALARILASEPDILMLDEPFSALDSNLKWNLEQELMELLSAFSGTTILVSHNRNEIYRFCDKVAVLNNGKIDTLSKKQELFNNPETVSAALLTGCKNISRAAKISEYSVDASDWGIILHSSRPIPDSLTHVGIRAHYLKYCENDISEHYTRDYNTNDYNTNDYNTNEHNSNEYNIKKNNYCINTMTCSVIKVIENPFSYIILLKNSAYLQSAYSIRWEVDKAVWEKICRKSEPLRLEIDPENLMLLS